MLVKSQVKYIQSLSQKKSRDEDAVFVAEGPKLINELLNAHNIQLVQLIATDDWISSQKPAVQKEKLIVVKASELERISFLTTPNHALGIFSKPKFPSVDLNTGISLMLDCLQDPGNLGSIIRCADWFGIKQVICSSDSADVFNPKVVQATMGSIARINVVYTDLAAYIKKHKETPVYAATLNGKALSEIKRIEKAILLIGNESKGIDPELLKLATQQITIPRKGEAESLNAAVATGIILSHLA
jgi:RNA methyltransferase, TrmH family